jgi:[ribosomal protein S5]-alanine N-acetyltransferase
VCPIAEIATTPRLILREQTLEDTDALAAVICDRKTMSFYPNAFTRDDARGWIERNMSSYDERGFGLWAMDLTTTGEFIGQCGLTLQMVEGEPHVEAGWHVHRSHWRKGYASEAGSAALDVAFHRLGLERVISLILKENVPSAGVARKLGMRIEREVVYKDLLHDLWVIEP